MSLTWTEDPTQFTCATCGSQVWLKTETMFTAQAPAGKVRSWRYECRRDARHELGDLVIQPTN